MRLECGQRGLEPGPPVPQVLQHGVHHRAGLLGVVRGLRAAVHVDRHARVTQFGQHPRPPLRIIVAAPPLVHHDDARPGTLDAVVPGQVPFHLGAAAAVRHFLGVDVCHGQVTLLLRIFEMIQRRYAALLRGNRIRRPVAGPDMLLHHGPAHCIERRQPQDFTDIGMRTQQEIQWNRKTRDKR